MALGFKTGAPVFENRNLVPGGCRGVQIHLGGGLIGPVVGEFLTPMDNRYGRVLDGPVH